MSKLKYLVIHCTDTPKGKRVLSEDIRLWHTGPRSKGHRGWSRVGYSDMIHLDGEVENLIPYNDNDIVDPWEISNGAKGYNSVSRHVVYVGGANNKDTRTFEQIAALEKYIKDMIENHPKIKVIGHNEVCSKYCPSFDVEVWLKGICVPNKNIGL